MQMNRPIIPLFKVFMSPEVDKPLLEVLHSGWIGEGPKVAEFEEKIANRIDNRLCLALSSGTHGLTLALRLIDIKRQGKGRGSVVSSPMSCFATHAPILDNGAEIIWADIKEDMNIDPDSVRKKIREDTKAIVFVHWGGYPADLEELYKISQEHDIPLVEDAAHSFGSYYKNRPIGDCNFSDYGIFSWQAIKNLTTGDGGMLFLKDSGDYDEAKLLRWFGIDRSGEMRDLRCRENIKQSGYKFHMNDICAVIGLENLKYFDIILKKIRNNAVYYNEHLKNVSGVKLIQTNENRNSSYWLFTILVEDRTGFARKMGEYGIAVSQVHARTDLHSCMSQYKSELPNLDYISQRHISIPVGRWVSEEDREFIVSSIKKGW